MCPETASETTLRIGELARRTGKTNRTLHFYEELGLLAPKARTKGGFRIYAEHTVLRVRWIERLKELGEKLNQATTERREPKTGDGTPPQQQPDSGKEPPQDGEDRLEGDDPEGYGQHQRKVPALQQPRQIGQHSDGGEEQGQEDRLERFVTGRRVAHSFDKADYSLTLLTCPSLPGKSPLPLFRRDFYHYLSHLWKYKGIKIEPKCVSLFNEDRWQERTAVVSDEGWIEQAAGVCFPARQRELIQEHKLFDDILPSALERAIKVYCHSFVQYYGSLRIRVSLQGVKGRRMLLREDNEDELCETSGSPDVDPVVCDRTTAVPALYESSGRSAFVESIVREVRRAFGELVFEPEASTFNFESLEEDFRTSSSQEPVGL